MSLLNPAQYWRENKQWSKWLGRKGKVVYATSIRNSRPNMQAATPYSLVLVDFNDERKLYMGAGQEVFETGDMVVCVLRKRSSNGNEELIDYGIKVRHVR